MTDILMVVVEGTPEGMVNLVSNGATRTGDEPAAADDFLIPNDGNTVVLIHAITGDTWVPVPVNCSHGRTHVMSSVVAAGDIAQLGPWDPQLWNDVDGYVRLTPTGYNIGDLLLAMRSAKPS